MDALARANELRIQRAQLKRDLKAGRHSIRRVLLHPPDYVETAKVFDLLLAVPSLGRVKVSKILAHCRIAPSKTIGGLSEPQRSELVALLDAGRDRPPALDPDDAVPAVWVNAVGGLSTERELVEALDVTPEEFTELLRVGRVLALVTEAGKRLFPDFQLGDGKILTSLLEAHQILVREGSTSPWSAASWIMAPHPELDGLSPSAWACAGRSESTLIELAERDAARLAA
jgi:hypothetical protein